MSTAVETQTAIPSDPTETRSAIPSLTAAAETRSAIPSLAAAAETRSAIPSLDEHVPRLKTNNTPDGVAVINRKEAMTPTITSADFSVDTPLGWCISATEMPTHLIHAGIDAMRAASDYEVALSPLAQQIVTAVNDVFVVGDADECSFKHSAYALIAITLGRTHECAADYPTPGMHESNLWLWADFDNEGEITEADIAASIWADVEDAAAADHGAFLSALNEALPRLPDVTVWYYIVRFTDGASRDGVPGRRFDMDEIYDYIEARSELLRETRSAAPSTDADSRSAMPSIFASISFGIGVVQTVSMLANGTPIEPGQFVFSGEGRVTTTDFGDSTNIARRLLADGPLWWFDADGNVSALNRPDRVIHFTFFVVAVDPTQVPAQPVTFSRSGEVDIDAEDVHALLVSLIDESTGVLGLKGLHFAIPSGEPATS